MNIVIFINQWLQKTAIEGVFAGQGFVANGFAARPNSKSAKAMCPQLDYVPLIPEKKRALTNTLDKIVGGNGHFRLRLE